MVSGRSRRRAEDEESGGQESPGGQAGQGREACNPSGEWPGNRGAGGLEALLWAVNIEQGERTGGEARGVVRAAFAVMKRSWEGPGRESVLVQRGQAVGQN